MTVEAFLACLEGVRPRGSRRWSARCPAHADRSPSLAIHEDKTKILVHCFSGCDPKEIVSAVGLEMRDLFMDSPISQGQQLTPAPQKLDLNDAAFRFELGALDRRRRAEQVLNAVAVFSGDGMAEAERDRLMKAVARAYDDQGRAEFLETVADDCRLLAYQERMAHHAA